MHESDQTQLPTLPNDLMFLIFKELSLKERIPLSTACKRFRELDFELEHKQFETIDISLVDFNQQFSVVGKGNRKYSIHGNITNPVNPTCHNLSMFRNAKTKDLNITCDQSPRSSFRIRDSDFNLIASICEQITFTSATIETNFCESSTIEHLISIIGSCSMKHAKVFIKSTASEFSSNLYSHLLMQLPTINKFRFELFTVSKWHNYREKGISESALLHIASQTNHTELDLVLCTAEGIRSAFEIVRNWEGYKVVVFNTDRTIVDQFVALADGIFACGDMRVTDHESRTVLILTKVTPQIVKVVICRIDSHNKIIVEDWN